jgi:hypothetical protein
MCTLIVSVSPSGPWPVLIAATRDEFRGRPWKGPDAWWPEENPGVIGGRDLESGGTWMAANPEVPRVALLLNRIEPTSLTAAEARSRGSLPLLAASAGAEAIAAEDLSLFRPFNLAVLEPGLALWWRYDGAALSRHEIPPGLHILTAADLDDMSNPRQRYWLPRFTAAEGPAPEPDDRAPAGWGDWAQLLADVDSPYDDPRALNVHRDDVEFGTVSASLAAIGDAGMKYEFCPGPPDEAEWRRVV